VLRALPVKPGKHEIVLSFFPKSITTTETIAYVAFGILLLLLIGMAVQAYLQRRKSEKA
jgi:hypothetical protein